MRFLEDFTDGLTLDLAPCEVTREEIVAFAEQYDPQPFHLDEAAAAATMLGGLAASGWHSCAIFMRMMVDGWLGVSASHGSPGIEEARWRRPLRPGDRLTGTSTVLGSKRLRKTPEYGLVSFRHEVKNGAGEAVLTMQNPILIRSRDAA